MHSPVQFKAQLAHGTYVIRKQDHDENRCKACPAVGMSSRHLKKQLQHATSQTSMIMLLRLL